MTGTRHCPKPWLLQGDLSTALSPFLTPPFPFSTCAQKLEPGMMVPFDLFGVPWVLFRDEHGAPTCIKDSCAHRACPLSLGKVINGHVQCPYHGWEFDGSGACTKMPSTRMCPGVGVAALPCVEKDGFVWVWPGDGPPHDLPPDFTAPPAGYDVHAEIMVGLLVGLTACVYAAGSFLGAR